MSGSSWTGRLVSAGVVLLVIALAAATFVVSYSGVRDLAVAVGVSSRLARIYPAILDGVLVVACAAVFMLRDRSLWRRFYAWFAVALMIAVIGAADALHAMNVALPKRPAAGTAAALPWALVLLGFSLWLTMLRRPRAAVAPPTSAPVPAPAPTGAPVAAEPAALDPFLLPALPPAPVSAEPATAEPAAAEPVVAEPVAAEPAAAEPPAPAEPIASETVASETVASETVEAEPEPVEPDSPTSDSAEPAEPTEAGERATTDESAEATEPAEAAEAEQPLESADTPDGGIPMFYRVRSVPIPPED
jgi:hypothetical protein